jgi:hypothetical protein
MLGPTRDRQAPGPSVLKQVPAPSWPWAPGRLGPPGVGPSGSATPRRPELPGALPPGRPGGPPGPGSGRDQEPPPSKKVRQTLNVQSRAPENLPNSSAHTTPPPSATKSQR